MALIAEEIVEEWLNRQGYFTIRGIKIGVQEIDLLAVKWCKNEVPECRHIEVQASIRPVSYISSVPKKNQKAGRAKKSAKCSDEELVQGVAKWVDKKFRLKKKKDLMASLWNGKWSSELVVNKVKSKDELKLIEDHGIKILRLNEIISSLLADKSFVIRRACGGDIVDLIDMGSQARGGA